MWHLTPDTWRLTLDTFFLWCFYLHTFRDSVSPMCGIFLLFMPFHMLHTEILSPPNCYATSIGPSPRDWRTMIHWNVVPTIFHNDHISQGLCKIVNVLLSSNCGEKVLKSIKIWWTQDLRVQHMYVTFSALSALKLYRVAPCSTLNMETPLSRIHLFATHPSTLPYITNHSIFACFGFRMS